MRLMRINLLALGCALLMFTGLQARNGYQERHIETALRTVGHRVLLAAGDSSSRVLPIQEDSGQYIIRFDTEFSLLPDDLVMTAKAVFGEAGITSDYILEVEPCGKKEVVYAFEMFGPDADNLAPCKGRELPKACYQLRVTLREPGSITTLNALSGNSGKPVSGTLPLVPIIGVLVAGIVLGYFFFRKKPESPPAETHLFSMGKFQLDERNGELNIAGETISLSGKEADLLLLLYQSANQTVEREVILNQVWGDEGDYIGRTLDVFISKLRKKLEGDPNVKIMNIRGVGYKLVIDG